MRTELMQTFRSNWFAVLVHTALWLLLYLVLTTLGGKAPAFREADSFSAPAQSPAAIAKLDNLFSPGTWTKSFAETNDLNPFFTIHFIPPSAPAPAPPTTRKIELTYQGFYQTGNSVKQTMIKIADGFAVKPVGSTVATNLFIAEATALSLTLTNLAGQTNVLSLNTQKVIEIPIQ
jgi:hypothetical protein